MIQYAKNMQEITMDKNSLDMLEFPVILKILSNYASFSASRDLILAITPSSDAGNVKLLLNRSSEARYLLSISPNFYIGRVFDVREQVTLASKGRVLEPQVLSQVRETLASIRNLRNSINKLANEVPLLFDLSQGMQELPAIEKEINKCINENNEIADAASEKLGYLRRQLKEVRQRLLDRLDTILKSKSKQKFIQEPYITEREGRYVIPVKADFKKDIRGIVHDVSNTGATVFMEPWEIVEQGNDLRQMLVEEQQEIEKILESLSGQIGLNATDICDSIGILAEIDMTLAKARYAEVIKAAEPIIGDGDEGEGGQGEGRFFRLVKARHPLLKGEAVPLDIEMGRDYNILVITGPNAGGKTVALKTMGLLALMTHAGIPIPASAESIVPIFDNIYADIGDQQSIENTLSTFSWHINNIITIINHSTGNSLVLLDELGISTDPEEGAALAKAILLHFVEKGSLVVSTTHYNDLKAFAHVNKGMRNASMDFDPVTFMPSYRLTIGVPGRSNALAVAARLGLLQAIINNARGMLSKESEKIEVLLTDLMEEKQKYEQMNYGLEQDRGEVGQLKATLQKEQELLRERESRLLTDVSDRILRDTAGLQKMIHEVETELRKSKKRETVNRAKKTAGRIHEQVNTQLQQAKAELGVTEEESVVDIGDINVGDIVKIRGENVAGTVVSINEQNENIDIKVGNTNISIKADSIEKIERGGKEISISFPISRKRRSGLMATSYELDLRGKRADEIYGILDKFLNDAFLSNLKDVRIIHGYATGTVRKIVREILSSHTLVKSFEPGTQGEGGDGVTMAHLT
jgi:DNA mismatch repair protein MutS2